MISFSLPVVLLSSLMPMVVGMVWYSKLFFADPWLAALGWSRETLEARKKAGMAKAFGGTFAAAIVQSFALAVFIHQLGVTAFYRGAWIGIWLALGIAIPASASSALFEGRSGIVWLINAGCTLVSITLTAGVLAAWS